MEPKRKIEDEIKFKELLKSPIRLFGWVFPYFFVVLLLFGIFFAHQLIAISFNQVPVGAPDSTNTIKEIVEKKGGITPAVNLEAVKNPTAEMIAKGKELFDANCQSCHGATGMGDGLAGAMLNPKPRNYHHAEGWTNGKNIDEMYKTLQEGIIKNGMAAYEYISPSDRFDIINYIRTFADFPPITDKQLSDLNLAYNLSAGTVTPNQIPVSKAEKILETENAQLMERIILIKNKIKNSQSSEGLSLLRNSASDLNKVIKSFLVSGENQNFEKFFNSVSNSPIIQGYNASVLKLNSIQWKTMFEYLKSVSV